jgi:predicted nucleic acid-binding protein
MKAPTNGDHVVEMGYLDASALVRLFVEDQSIPALGESLAGRRDLFTSDLAITEFTSAVCRLRREGRLTLDVATRAYRELVDQIREGTFQLVEFHPAVHRGAEERLLATEGIELRASDALHLAAALLSGCTTLITYDRRLAEASRRHGLAVFPTLAACSVDP